MRMLPVMALYGLAVTGCAAMEDPYPADWPERSVGTACQISGAYNDLGEFGEIDVIPRQQGVAHLSWLLLEGRVGPNDHSKPKPLRPNGDVVCESDGALTLRFDSVTATSYRHAEVTVWSAADGSLIVRRQDERA